MGSVCVFFELRMKKTYTSYAYHLELVTGAFPTRRVTAALLVPTSWLTQSPHPHSTKVNTSFLMTAVSFLIFILFSSQSSYFLEIWNC